VHAFSEYEPTCPRLVHFQKFPVDSKRPRSMFATTCHFRPSFATFSYADAAAFRHLHSPVRQRCRWFSLFPAEPAQTPMADLTPCHEPEPSPLGKQSSPTSSSDASTYMASPCFSFMFGASKAEREGRASSAGSSDFDELAQVQQLPPLDLQSPSTPTTVGMDTCTSSHSESLSYQGTLSPRQQSGKRYHGGYLQHRVPLAAGLLKSWKRKYFRLREHGIVCYKCQDSTTPLFEVRFTAHSVLAHAECASRNNSFSTSGAPNRPNTARPSPKAEDGCADQVDKGRRTSWPNRTASSSGSLTLILKHVEVTGHQTPAKAVEVPVFLKAETEADHAEWTECLRHMIEAHKRTKLEKGQSDEDTDEMTSPTQTQSDSPARRGSDASSQEVSKMPRRRRSSGSAVAPDLVSALNSLVEVEPYEAFAAKYLLMKEIGEGSFSIVHRAVNRMTGQLCAVKCCKISAALEEEERLLRTLVHPNVVNLEGVYARDESLHFVVMDYLKDGDLCDLLIERQRLPEPEARRIIRQVVEGLAYLHRRCVLHRDIKPENILIHGNIVKIADFGLAKELAQPSTMLKRSCGTLEYAAPELLCGRPYGLKSDVFSLGIVLYVLLFGAFPFSVESAASLQCMDHFPTGVDVRDMSCLSRSNVQWRLVSPLAQDVLLQMLKVNDAERISAEDLLGHPWFDEIDDAMSGFTSSVGSSPEELELARIDDCEALGFAELISRGFQAVKYGFRESTTPHPTTLSLDFIDECITWTARKNPMLMRVSSVTSENGAAEGSTKRGRAIPLREITEIREGHTTDALLSYKNSTPLPPPELCLSIICPWRTLDLVVEAPTQREFMARGLRRLLPSSPQ
jgi:serine/threonine protein kinase